MAASSKKLKLLDFTRVIIDEATQAKEVEILFTLKTATQVVLIGDHKQLGPIYKVDVGDCDSMFRRLVIGGYPYIMLDT